MLYLMSNNRINALLEVGVPLDTRVAHKHGWIPDTHGDAGIIFTPGGNYVLVVVLHNPTWLDFSESFPLTAEISREVYNYFNADAPVEAIRPANVPDANSCTVFGTPLVENLMAGNYSD
jgi:beta-lactamase class A